MVMGFGGSPFLMTPVPTEIPNKAMHPKRIAPGYQDPPSYSPVAVSLVPSSSVSVLTLSVE